MSSNHTQQYLHANDCTDSHNIRLIDAHTYTFASEVPCSTSSTPTRICLDCVHHLLARAQPSSHCVTAPMATAVQYSPSPPLAVKHNHWQAHKTKVPRTRHAYPPCSAALVPLQGWYGPGARNTILAYMLRRGGYQRVPAAVPAGTRWHTCCYQHSDA